MADQAEEVVLTMTLSIRDIQRILNQTLAGADVENAQYGPLDERDDIGIVASKMKRSRLTSMVGGAGKIVHVYVNDNGNSRRVQVVAVGPSMASRLYHGAANTISFGASKNWRDEIVQSLKAADPGATIS